MKKGLKITLITLASVIGTAAVLSCTVGGMPFKAYAEKNYETIDETWSDYPYYNYKTPSEWKTVTDRGISLKMPADLRPQSDEGFKKHFYISEDKSWHIMFITPTDFGTLDLADPDAAADLKEKMATWMVLDFAKKKDIELRDWYSYFSLIYSMNLDDCRGYSLRRGAEFALVGYLKEETGMFGAELWEWHTADGDGYIRKMGNSADESPERCRVFAELFPNGERNQCYTALITTPSAEETAQVVNSIRLTGEPFEIAAASDYDTNDDTEENTNQD